MVERFADRATGTLSAGITSGDLSLTLDTGQGTAFPSGNFDGVLEVGSLYASTLLEHVRCTSRSGDVLTIERGQQGTAAAAFPLGARFQHRITARALALLRDQLVEGTLYNRYTPPTGFFGARGSTSDDPWGIMGGGVTAGTVTLATASQLGGQSRARLNSTATALGPRGFASDGFFRGNAAGLGGFRFEGKFGCDVANNGCRMFCGLVDLTTALLIATLDPGSASSNALFGFGHNNASIAASGNLRFFHNAGFPGPVTDLDTTISRTAMTTNIIYYLIEAAANAGSIHVVIKDLVAGTLFDQTISSNIPSATTLLVPQFSIRGNGGASTGQLSAVGNELRPTPW